MRKRLNNFSQDDIEEGKKLEQNTPQDDKFDDIQFEELIDVDALHSQLKDKIEKSKLGIEESEESESEIVAENLDSEVKSVTATDINEKQKPLKKEPNSKKYVIYINSDNIDFMENLSIEERKKMINKILKEQNEISTKNKELEAKKRYFINLILACITFIISFPILFYIVNKATEATIKNYDQARQNFSTLYKERGKIKQNR